MSRAEQSRAEQSRAEQSRAEQSRAEQSRAEQSRAERLSYLIGHSLVGMSARAVIAMADLRGLEKGLWVNGGGPLYGQLYFNPLSITSQLRRAQSLTTAHHAKRIRYHHRLLTYQELGDIAGLSATVIANRYRRGKREDQLVVPLKKGHRARQIEIDGEQLTVAEIAKRAHVTTRTIRDRYEKGLRGKELLVSHVKTRKGKLITFKGEELTAGELAERYPKLSADQIQARYRRGKRDDQLVAPIRSNKSRPELLSG